MLVTLFSSDDSTGKFHMQVTLFLSFTAVPTPRVVSPTVVFNCITSGRGGPTSYNSLDTFVGTEWILTVSVSMISSPYFKVGLTTRKDL